jgi:hypothetical protein
MANGSKTRLSRGMLLALDEEDVRISRGGTGSDLNHNGRRGLCTLEMLHFVYILFCTIARSLKI